MMSTAQRLKTVYGHPRLLAMLVLSVLTVSGLFSVTEHLLFTQPSLLKYVLTVGAPMAALLLVGTDRAADCLVVLLILVAPFGFSSVRGGIPVTPLVLVLVPTALVMHYRPRPAHGHEASRLRTWAVVCALALAPALIAGVHRALYVEVVASGLLTGYVVAQVAKRASGRELVILAVLASSGLQASLATWEFMSGHKLNLYGAANGSQFGPDYFFSFGNKDRATAAFPDPISLGNVLALALPLTVVAAIIVRGRWQRLAVAAFGLLLVIGLVTTLSRLSWIAAAAGVLVTVAFLPSSRRLAAGVAVLGVGAASISAAILVGGSALTRRFDSISNPTSSQVQTASGDRTRLELQDAAFDVGHNHPITGVGFGRLEPYLLMRVPDVTPGTHAHNTYFQLFAEAGLLGVGVLVLLYAAAAADLIAGGRQDRLAGAGCAGALVALALVWTTDFTIRNSAVMAMTACIFGIASSLGTGRRAARTTYDASLPVVVTGGLGRAVHT
jgi:O-antigen ligase